MKILSVDDNPQNRKVIELSLKNDFDVISNDGNSEILQLMAEHSPDLVLLDIMLENKTGYDLCDSIRDEMDYDDTIIVFVSALNSADDKLKAYGCGGDDYICKPIDVIELREKMVSMQKRIEQQKQLKMQSNMATQAAFASMQQASELGELIKFTTDSIDVKSIEELYAKIRDYFLAAGLNVCLELRCNNEHHIFPEEQITLLEREILELGRSAKRIAPFGPNILFNSKFCSLMVKKLPIHDEDQIGRLRDNFAIMLSLIDNKMMFFASEASRASERKAGIEKIKASLAEDFGTIKHLANRQETKILEFVTHFAETIEIKLMVLGLDEDQESEIRELADEIKEMVKDSADLSFVIDEKLTAVETALSKLQ